MMRRRTLLAGMGAGALIAAAGGAAVARAFRHDMARAVARIGVADGVVRTRAGAVEWAAEGAGRPVLMLHGTGGGFDQGLLFARPLARRGWRILAPSRFGYLGSAMPADASAEAQADALADLLDALGLDRVPVIGGSAGALPAIAFAIRHPERCAALVALVPATFAPGRPPMRPDAIGAAIMAHALQSDLLFWTGLQLAEARMTATLLATDPALVAAAPAPERARVRAILHGILPVSRRAAGILHDAAAAGNPAAQALERIRAPTLAVSAVDDRFLTADAARHIAAGVPGARLHLMPDGGHVWVGRDAEVMDAVDAFLRAT
jgi:pimeloyl-ACP methyl ester carboxylesterase